MRTNQYRKKNTGYHCVLWPMGQILNLWVRGSVDLRKLTLRGKLIGLDLTDCKKMIGRCVEDAFVHPLVNSGHINITIIRTVTSHFNFNNGGRYDGFVFNYLIGQFRSY